MKNWRLWIGIVISAVFLYLSLRGLELDDFWTALQGANYWWLIPGVAVYFLGVWVRAWRWHYMLRPLKKIPTSTMFPIVAIGYMGNNIYPARAGEVLRAAVLRQREGVPHLKTDAGKQGARVDDVLFADIHAGVIERIEHARGVILGQRLQRGRCVRRGRIGCAQDAIGVVILDERIEA